MKELLKTWQGKIFINGRVVKDIDKADFGGALKIKLVPKEKSLTVITKVVVKSYMLKRATPQFDFMSKWNNDNPMPTDTMYGYVTSDTRGMVRMALWKNESNVVLNNSKADWEGWIIRSAIRKWESRQ